MKQWLLILGMGFLSLNQGNACDACGCGPVSLSWGIMPNNNSHYIGFRSQLRLFRSVHPNDTPQAGLSGREQFYRHELIGRIFLHRRLQAVLILPYRYTYLQNAEETLRYKGLSDASATLMFLPVIPGEEGITKHALQLSAGIEVPTGKFRFSHDIPSMLQAGSGTWDMVAGLNYTLRYRDLGLNTEASLKINGTTADRYHPGDVLTAGGKLFYTIRKKLTRFIPSAGFHYEKWDPDQPDVRYDIRVPYTGGHISSFTAGFDVFAPSMAIGIEYGRPVNQIVADGWTTMNHSFNARLLLFIQSKKLNKKESTTP